MVSYLKKKLFTKRRNKLNEIEQSYFLERLYRFLSHGYPLLESLKKMEWDPNLRKIAQEFSMSLKQGTSLENTFEELSFHPTIVTYMSFVKANNNLLETIEKCKEMYDYRIENVKKIKQTIKYPLVLFVFFFMILILIKQFVLPSFTNFFLTDSDSAKSVIYSIMIIDVVSNILIVMTIALLIAGIIFKALQKKLDVEQMLRIYQRIPLYRNLLKLQTSYYFTLQMSMFLKTGLSLKAILTHLSSQTENVIINHYAKLMIKQLENGENLSHLIVNLSYLELNIAQIFDANIDSSLLERDLSAYSEQMNEQIKLKIDTFIARIQPILFIVIALFIVFIYATLMWPMIQLMQTI